MNESCLIIATSTLKSYLVLTSRSRVPFTGSQNDYRIRKCCFSIAATRRLYASSSPNTLSSPNPNSPTATNTASNGKVKDKLAERDFFLSVLSATTTKRDAKSYLSRFRASKSPNSTAIQTGGQQHISLIKIRATESLDDRMLDGLAHTFSQLNRLGSHCVIVVDTDPVLPEATHNKTRRDAVLVQADRIVAAFSRVSKSRARRIDGIITALPADVTGRTARTVTVDVVNSDILRSTIDGDMISVIPILASTSGTHRNVVVDADSVLLALTKHFAGLPTTSQPTQFQANSPSVVDRIVLLDPLGGLPSSTRDDRAHIFVNLEQEYEEIKSDLTSPRVKEMMQDQPFIGGGSMPADISETSQNKYLRNLETLNQVLSMLPPSSSAMLTTANEAATFNESCDPVNPILGVQTRSPRNPLIYNLLTDKPLISSSLPVKRLAKIVNGSKPHQASAPFFSPATFVKRGMTVTLVPDPRQQAWEPPRRNAALFNIDDPRVDFPRLLNLIEDSFGRQLDVGDYLKRIRDRTAGIIVAGEYEGGAILTWELPPGVPDDSSEASRQRMVPYLDKFAVLKRSQGAGGVADIVFTCMVRSCFPKGVCWRSRKDNPVNKWYFERSVGTRKLADSKWTMFWTTDGLHQDFRRLQDYEAVCKAIEPSWADNKHLVD